MAEGTRPCRCLLREVDPEHMGRVIAEYVESLPEDEKVSPELYRARLHICERCQRLMNGTCVLCGCYVEARAAKKRMACPDAAPKWGPAEL